MSKKVYDAERVDGFLKQASEAMHGVIGYAEGVVGEKAKLEQENSSLRKELAIAKEAAANKVTLEKVAAPAAAPLNLEKVSMFIDKLIARGQVQEHRRAEFIDKCASSGNIVLDVALTALQLSEAPVSQGHGIKSATTNTGRTPEEQTQAAEDDLWKKHMGWD